MRRTQMIGIRLHKGAYGAVEAGVEASESGDDLPRKQLGFRRRGGQITGLTIKTESWSPVVTDSNECTEGMHCLGVGETVSST